MLEAETALAELVAALATVDADMCVILYIKLVWMPMSDVDDDADWSDVEVP